MEGWVAPEGFGKHFDSVELQRQRPVVIAFVLVTKSHFLLQRSDRRTARRVNRLLNAEGFPERIEGGNVIAVLEMQVADVLQRSRNTRMVGAEMPAADVDGLLVKTRCRSALTQCSVAIAQVVQYLGGFGVVGAQRLFPDAQGRFKECSASV